MSDFFSGIFDSLRGVADSTDSFFDSAIGEALGQGLKGYAKSESSNRQRELEAGRINFQDSRGFSTTFSPTREIGYEESEDFSRDETEWLTRMQRFANIAKSTEVKL